MPVKPTTVYVSVKIPKKKVESLMGIQDFLGLAPRGYSDSINIAIHDFIIRNPIPQER